MAVQLPLVSRHHVARDDGLGVDTVMRRVGRDEVGTAVGHVKQAEDLTPFGALLTELGEPNRSGDVRFAAECRF